MDNTNLSENRGVIYSILSVMPGIGSVWGLVFYAIFSYIVTFIIVGGINYWANKSIDINKIVKDRITE